MSKKLRTVVERNNIDSLVAGAFETDVFSVTLKGLAEPKTLKKGTLLAVSSKDNKYVILGTETVEDEKLIANAILAEDVEVSASDIVATAFRQGHFNRNSVIVANDYTINTNDIDNLRNAGIYFEASI